MKKDAMIYFTEHGVIILTLLKKTGSHWKHVLTNVQEHSPANFSFKFLQVERILYFKLLGIFFVWSDVDSIL